LEKRRCCRAIFGAGFNFTNPLATLGVGHIVALLLLKLLVDAGGVGSWAFETASAENVTLILNNM
jgi:hypothetical protein